MTKINEKCGLCLKNSDLVESHLIPQSIYKIIVQESLKLNNPLLIKGNKKLATSKQVKSTFLCPKCEGRLSNFGEDHVLRNIYRKPKEFRLQTILKGLKPIEKVDGSLVYCGNKLPNIKIDHFLHFASGIFWKTSAGKWTFLGEKLNSKTLGNKYEDKFRKYLLGNEKFPENAILTMKVSNEKSPFPVCIFPHANKINGLFHHRFYIPGIEFILRVGNLIPNEQKAFSLSNTSGGLIFFESLDNSNFINAAKKYMKRKRVPLGKLKKLVKHQKCITS